MAWSSLFFLSLAVIFLLAFFYLRSMYQMKRLQSEADMQLSAIKKEKENLENKLQDFQSKLHSAIEDPVTSLLGWQLFEDRLNQSIKESARYQFTLGVLYVDIDNFKVINEALGYETGDQLLYETAVRLQSSIRQFDNVTRLSKDTFVISLSKLSKPETAAIVAERILQEFRNPFLIKDQELHITVGIGIAVYPLDGEDRTTLLRNAEYALHLAKQKGKNIYQFYQEKINTESRRELLILLNLKNESVFQEFNLYYQPIFNVKKETLFCMDASMHWDHPELGVISPEELFLYAERQHQLNAISEWMLKSAGKKFLEWRSLGLSPQYLGIPMQIKQLENTQFIYRISKIMQELNFNPEWLLLELRESPIQQSFDVLEKAFNMLNYLGIKLAIDNFGAGPFSFSYLKNINIHYLMIDRSFSTQIDQNAKAYNLIKSILFLAQNLSIQTIVKGIESREQMQKLVDLNCELMQGQLLSPPLSEQDVTKKMVTL